MSDAGVLSGRISRVIASGATLHVDTPLACDRVWLAMSSENAAVVEAEVVWSDYASAGPGEIQYGVNFLQVLDETELPELIETLIAPEDVLHPLAPSVRQREECLFALFRGHSPHGARSSSTY